MTDTDQPTTPQTVRVRDVQGNVETFPGAVWVQYADDDLGIYQAGGSVEIASFARGQWVSVRTDAEQPESATGRQDEPLPPPLDLLESAWLLVANAHEGDWNQATEPWREAAERFRDRYHAHLDIALAATGREGSAA